MVLNVAIKLDLGDAFTAYDRLALSDLIVKGIKSDISKERNCKLVSISGTIEEEGKTE